MLETFILIALVAADVGLVWCLEMSSPSSRRAGNGDEEADCRNGAPGTRKLSTIGFRVGDVAISQWPISACVLCGVRAGLA